MTHCTQRAVVNAIARVEARTRHSSPASPAKLEPLEARRLLSATVLDFGELPVGPLDESGDPAYEAEGFTLTPTRSSGSAQPNNASIYGPAQGYPSKVVQPPDWGDELRITRQDGETFDFTSFDYAAGRWGDSGDFVPAGTFADGSTESRAVAFSGKSLSALDIDW